MPICVAISECPCQLTSFLIVFIYYIRTFTGLNHILHVVKLKFTLAFIDSFCKYMYVHTCKIFCMHLYILATATQIRKDLALIAYIANMYFFTFRKEQILNTNNQWNMQSWIKVRRKTGEEANNKM